MRTASWLVGLCSLCGFGNLTSTSCTDIALPGIRLEVMDSVPGNSSVHSLKAIATDGTYADTVELRDLLGEVWLAEERAGTYRLQITASGCVPWVRDDVRVTADECHVQPVDLVARLQRGTDAAGDHN